ncbi:hypothetical protein T440DRAFT_287057 [Plenodomus tracheiphilus IPT5]|uniref:Uncharacterized protein n=1 Tax=Plenodomus tracheiphilus IPT5 TaxID=1408161 RepID=A0A6A7BHY1_9PLEO|nr:hypothetical protein T440DRAFT_287057 [Plenodomus tracheiphilus IPT5]
MATDLISDVRKMQLDTVKAEYGGKMSNQFVAELKGSTLFQFNWSELLSAAPTALSLMGGCWLAASDPKAEKIFLTNSVPTKGFTYLTNRKDPTLRSCLVDVCNNGGRQAFMIAGRNMDALQVASQRITAERIILVFERLSRCTQGEDQLEDFRDALNDFAHEAKNCAKLATEIRIAFNTWGKMVGELHACTEAQLGKTAQDRDVTTIDQAVAEIDQRFTTEAATETKAQVTRVTKQLEKAEKRLDNAIENVPGPWASTVQGAVGGFLQAVPSIVGAVLPAVLEAANPMAGVAKALSAGQNKGRRGGKPVKRAPANDTGSAQGHTPQPSQVAVVDSSYVAASALRDLVTHFYEYLGGDNGPVDWTRFEEKTSDAAKDTPTGISYFLGNINGQKAKVDVTDTDANKRLMWVFDTLSRIATELREFIKSKDQISSGDLSPQTHAAWKRDAKKAKEEILQLASVSTVSASGTVVNPFANIKIDIPKADTAAQIAQVNSAIQGVQMAQASVDAAQTSYDNAIAKQAKMATAMAEVEARLKKLKEAGQTLDEIKTILRDSISVLVDLSIQVGRVEQFFTMLTTVIDEVVMPRADTFNKEMDKAGRRANRDGAIKVDDISKQVIYTSTLQLKAYFSLLQDIASMYSQIHRQYIIEGIELCATLSKGAASNNPLPEVQDRLSKYTEESARAVSKLVDEKQQEILKGLRDRARIAAEGVQLLENTATQRGFAIDNGSKKAIESGAQTVKDDAKALLEADVSATVEAEIDANDW